MAVWEWDAVAGGWRRTQNGEAHVDAGGRQVAPPNVVLQFVPYRDTGLVDSSGTSVPEAEVVGEGEAWILTGGTLIPVTWSKPDAKTSHPLRRRQRERGPPHPGQTWVELVPPGQGTAWTRWSGSTGISRRPPAATPMAGVAPPSSARPST